MINGVKHAVHGSFYLIVASLTTMTVLAVVNVSRAAGEKNKPTGLSLVGVIQIERNASGQVARVVIVNEKAKLPKELMDLLPKYKNTDKLARSSIEKLARKQRLFTEWEVNPVLQFQAGDISYWFEQEKSSWNVELQFFARRIVIESAETAEADIPSQGDLSALSSPVFSWLHKNARAKWKKK